MNTNEASGSKSNLAYRWRTLQCSEDQAISSAVHSQGPGQEYSGGLLNTHEHTLVHYTHTTHTHYATSCMYICWLIYH